MNHGSVYASTADVLAKANVEDMVKSARNFAKKLPTQDMLGVFVFCALFPLGFLYTILFPLSAWFEVYSKEWLIRVIPLLYFGFNLHYNAWKMTKVGPNSPNGAILPSVQKPGFKFCHDCQLNSPPRSFHCPVCNICIFRRDHHCSFTACCVGHFNQRFFMAAVVNLLPIAFACFVWNVLTMLNAFPNFIPLDFWKCMFPHVALILGFISLHQFLLVSAFAFSTLVFIFSCYQFGAQIFCFLRGQTRVEYLMDIHAYDLGFWQNVTQGLGDRWLFALFVPFINSSLQSDGLSFRTMERETVQKTTKYF